MGDPLGSPRVAPFFFFRLCTFLPSTPSMWVDLFEALKVGMSSIAWNVSRTKQTQIHQHLVKFHQSWHAASWKITYRRFRDVFLRGWDESERHRAESQWIVAARPLCHLQYPVAYLSRLQRILPAAWWELYFKAACKTRPSHRLSQRHVPLGAEAPTAGRQTGGRHTRRF